MSEQRLKIDKGLERIQGSVELLYQQKTGTAIQGLDETLQSMLEIIDTVFSYKRENMDFSLDEERLRNTMVEALAAMEDKDMVLFADILQYDFIEYVEKLAKEME